MTGPQVQAGIGGSDLRIRPTRTGIRVEATGNGSLEATMECWLAIATRVRERHSGTVLLIDETRGPPLHPEQWQALVDGMRGQGLEGVRIAHVKPLGLQGVENCEIFAREAGFEARVFADETTAELWLRYGSQDDGS